MLSALLLMRLVMASSILLMTMHLLWWHPQQKDIALCLLQLPDRIDDMSIPLPPISPAGCVDRVQFLENFGNVWKPVLSYLGTVLQRPAHSRLCTV